MPFPAPRIPESDEPTPAAIHDNGLASTLEGPSEIAGSPWRMLASSSEFLGQVNPLWAWGFNIGPAGTRFNEEDASASWMIEANYKTSGPDHEHVETHFDMIATDGTERRLFGITVDRDDPDGYAAIGLFVSSTQAFTVGKVADGSALFTLGGGGSLTLGQNAAQIIFGGNIAQIQATQGPLYLTTASGVQMSGGVGFNGQAPSYPLIATGTGKTVDQLITVLQGMGLVRQS